MYGTRHLRASSCVNNQSRLNVAFYYLCGDASLRRRNENGKVVRIGVRLRRRNDSSVKIIWLACHQAAYWVIAPFCAAGLGFRRH
jgi:hypothetical protein